MSKTSELLDKIEGIAEDLRRLRELEQDDEIVDASDGKIYLAIDLIKHEIREEFNKFCFLKTFGEDGPKSKSKTPQAYL